MCSKEAHVAPPHGRRYRCISQKYFPEEQPMRHSKPFFILSSITVIMVLLLLAACGGGTAPSSNAGTTSGQRSASDIHVGFVSETSSLNFASEMASGAQYAANQYHINAQIAAPPNIDDEAAVKL